MAKKKLFQEIKSAKRLTGEVVLPGDKSISHRAAMLGSLASGNNIITNFSPGHDCSSTLRCLKALGVRIERSYYDIGTVHITGVGLNGLNEACNVLNAGNSGTTMRLLSGILAAQPFLSVINGDTSLRSRPMKRIIEPLVLMGAEIHGRCNNSLAPLVIRGRKLQGISYSLPVPSAQVKSAIMLAGLFAEGKTVIMQGQTSRDHTERLLIHMGAKIDSEDGCISVLPLVRALKPLNLTVPGDISSAAYWIVAAAIHPDAQIRIVGCGINPTRTGIIDILLNMGAKIELGNQRLLNNEPVADIFVKTSQLNGIEIKGEIVPRLIDEIPILAVAACFAKGNSIIKDAGELRVKESDRIATTVAELSRLGARIEALPDGMIINGGTRLTGTTVQSHSDHRLAMSLAIAGLVARGTTSIERSDVVEISYPQFWNTLENIINN